MKLDILKAEHESLRVTASPVSAERFGTQELRDFGKDMIEAMLDDDGIGLAAPQVGVADRIIVATIDGTPGVYVNPEVVTGSKSLIDFEEGCLSIPGVFGLVERHKKVKVKAFTVDGLPVVLSLKNLNGVVFQHEIDHLDGILFTDKVKRLTHNGTTIV